MWSIAPVWPCGQRTDTPVDYLLSQLETDGTVREVNGAGRPVLAAVPDQQPRAAVPKCQVPEGSVSGVPFQNDADVAITQSHLPERPILGTCHYAYPAALRS